MNMMKMQKRLLFFWLVAIFCLGCNKQDDLLIRTMVMGGGLMSNAGYNSSIRFNTDGTSIVNVFRLSMECEMINVWRVSDGSLQCAIRFITESGRPSINVITFDPSGQLLVSGASDDSIRIWRVSDGLLLKTFKSPCGQIRDLCFSPDGKILAGCHYTGALVLWKTENDSVIRIQWPPSMVEGPFMSAKFNSDGSELITGTLYGQILFLRAKDGAILRKFGARGTDLISLIVSRSENVLATIHDQVLSRYGVSAMDHSSIRLMKTHPLSGTSL